MYNIVFNQTAIFAIQVTKSVNYISIKNQLKQFRVMYV